MNQTRRTFVKSAAISVAGLAYQVPSSALSALSDTTHLVPTAKQSDRRWVASLVAKGTRKPYRGRKLRTIGMPCGGICTGQFYVRGDGTLAQWWIAGNAYNTGTVFILESGAFGQSRGPWNTLLTVV